MGDWEDFHADDAQGDRDYWNTKYAEASCHEHGADDMHWDPMEGEWFCGECFINDELTEIYNNG